MGGRITIVRHLKSPKSPTCTDTKIRHEKGAYCHMDRLGAGKRVRAPCVDVTAVTQVRRDHDLSKCVIDKAIAKELVPKCSGLFGAVRESRAVQCIVRELCGLFQA